MDYLVRNDCFTLTAGVRVKEDSPTNNVLSSVYRGHAAIEYIYIYIASVRMLAVGHISFCAGTRRLLPSFIVPYNSFLLDFARSIWPGY
jgi:hypothetical protein